MKKKLCLLLATATMSIGVVSLVAISNNQNGFSRVYGENEPVTLNLASEPASTVSEGVYRMYLRGNTGQRVGINIVGADAEYLESGQIRASSAGAYIYSVDACRGIDQFRVSFNSFPHTPLSIYFSYNPLNIDKILAGKYQDLCCLIDSGHYYNYTITKTNFPQIAGTRYFLAYIAPLSTLSISAISVTATCQDEPPAVDEGTNSGTLNAYYKSFIQAKTNGVLNEISQIGHGAYFINPLEDYFNYFEQLPLGGSSAFIDNIVASGFTKTYEVENGNRYIEYYQKKISDVVHTFCTTCFDSAYLTSLTIEYSTEFPYLVNTSEWPTDDVNNSIINPTYRSLISPFEHEDVTTYTFYHSTYEEMNMNIVEVIAVFPEDYDSTSLIAAYLNSYSSKGFNVIASGPAGQAIYSDTRFSIMTQINGNQAAIIFMEKMLLSEFPTSKVLERLNIDQPSLFLPYAEESGSFELSSGSSGSHGEDYESKSTSVSYYDITESDMNTYKSKLIAAGYVEDGSNYTLTYGPVHNSIRITITSSSFSITYTDYSSSYSNTFPKEGIADYLRIPNSDLIISCSGENAYFHRQSYGLPGYDDGYNYLANCVQYFGLTVSEIAAYKEQLVAAGYVLRSSDPDVYRLTYGYAGDWIEVIFNENQFEFRYCNKSASYSDVPSLTSAIGSLGLGWNEEQIQSVVNAIPNQTSYTYKRSYSKIEAVVIGAGQDFIDDFASAENLIYIEEVDAYTFANSTYGVKLQLSDGAVILKSVNVQPYSDLTTYETFNQQFNDVPETYRLSLTATDALGKRFLNGTSAFYGYSQSEADNFVSLISNRLIANGFVYSSYMNAYVKVDTADADYGYSISRSIETFGERNFYRVYVNQFRQEFVDYQSYNDLNLGDNTFLALFPDFSFDKDEDLIVVNSGWSDYLSLDFAMSLSDYEVSLLNNDFVDCGNNSYLRVDPLTGQSYYVDESSSFTSLTFKTGETFYNATNLWAQFDASDVTKFNDVFAIKSHFNSSDAKYRGYMYTNSFELVAFNSVSDINEYREYLISEGFEYLSNYYSYGNYYYKYNNDFSKRYVVSFADYSAAPVFITFEIQDVPTLYSFSDLMDAAILEGYDYTTNSEYLIYPTGNHFYEYSISGNNIGFNVLHDFDVDAYVAILEASDKYVSTETKGIQTIVTLENGVIEISDYRTFYNIYLKNSYREGKTFEDAIEASLGENAYSITGELTYFAFTPEESGTYSFTNYIEGGCDTYAYLYNSEHIQITFNDDSGDDLQFKITYHLEAGQTYYIGARLYNSKNTDLYASTLIVSLVDK